MSSKRLILIVVVGFALLTVWVVTREPMSGEPMSELEKTLKSAERGNADAQYCLGNRYYIGEGVPQDYVGAAKWFRKAADQGHGKAQFSLGEMYNYGDGVSPDNVEAAKWYRLAAEQGYVQEPGVGRFEWLSPTLKRAQGVRPINIPAKAESWGKKKTKLW